LRKRSNTRKNLGELDGADAVGTVIAVASVATELIPGKTVEEALSMNGADLSAPLGSLPLLKIHCAQLVEETLRSALAPDAPAPEQKNGAADIAAAAASAGARIKENSFKAFK
jgi:NifU homolog involved in Fe-S cluster formation